MKNIVKKIILNKVVASTFIKPLLLLDNGLYRLISILAIAANDGTHPKHNILRYTDWFVNHVSTDDVVLDVGCNTGTLPKALSSVAAKIYGIEIESHLIEQAHKLHSADNIFYITADATTYDYSAMDPISVLTLSNVLEHIEHRVSFLKKLQQQVKWSGDAMFLIRVPMRDREWVSIYKKQLGLEWRLDTTHFTEYTEQEFGDEMTEAGLKVVSVEVRFGELYAVCHKK